MNKENVLFGIIGLLAGLIIGFMFANSINQGAILNSPAGVATQGPNAPQGAPAASGENLPEVQAAIDTARKEKDNFAAQIKAAELYTQIQRYDGAIEFLTRANQLQPDNYAVIVQLGNANFDSNNYLEADKWYSAALEKKPDDVNVRTDLGLTFMFRQTPDFERAIKEFTQSLSVNPKHTQTLQNLTVAYTKTGNAEKAKETLARLEAEDPTNAALAQLKADIQKLGTPGS
ncbi:MAG: tetratricopeptide repeat protein [Acidobacteriota bacterium]|nr:tetratricopeptide repeat protein [Acidobacteriota bacterium]MDH3529181.1 tetratricopeptide repeat protein [Acidobacteriota bacterium]